MTTTPGERAWYRLKIQEARILKRHITYLPAEAAAIRRAGLWDDDVCVEANGVVRVEWDGVVSANKPA